MNALLQQAILIIDTVLIGGLGAAPLAAMGVAVTIAGVVMGLLFALSNGAQVLIAQAFGAADEQALRSGFWSAMIVAMAIATLGIAVIALGHSDLVGALAQTPHIAALASSYLVIFTIVIGGVAICQTISVFFYATGHARLPFFSKILELPCNALISYALIYGVAGLPEMGLRGAAIGSAVAVLLRTVFLVTCLLSPPYRYLLTPAWTRHSIVTSLRAYLDNALPIAGTAISISLSVTVCMMIYSQLPIAEFAAMTIIVLWVRSSGQLVTAWCQATGILVGQLLGARQRDALDTFVGKAWRVALLLGGGITVFYASSSLLFAIVYPHLDADTHQALRAVIPVLMALPLIRASNTVCGNVLRAGGQSKYSFGVQVTAQWLFTVPMSALFVLVLQWPIAWVFAIILVEELLKALPFHARMRSGVWKQRLVT